MDDLHRGFLIYRKNIYPLHKASLEHLAEEGQRPTTLIIGCSDSRVMIAESLQTRPGRLFIVRNAGNIVPHWGRYIGGVTASIEFAVNALPIREIIVCGHSGCGAIDAMLYPEKVESMPAVQRWLSFASEAPGRARKLDPEAKGARLQELVARENVLLQLDHLRGFPCVQEHMKDRDLKLYGWYFAPDRGELWEYIESENLWRTIPDIVERQSKA